MSTLADRIKSERKAKGLTQEVLGKIVGVGKSSVSQWENGLTKKMDGTNMVLTAKALGVSPDWLATGKGEKQLSQPNTNFSSLMAVASPKTHAILETLEKAYQQGRLTEDDLKLLDSIAKRLISETPKTQSTSQDYAKLLDAAQKD